MRRTLLLCSVCLLTLFSYGQTQTEDITTLFTNPTLTAQAKKIQDKEGEITASTSRANYNQLVEAKNALMKEYCSLINTELSLTTDPTQQKLLNDELGRINAILSQPQTTQR